MLQLGSAVRFREVPSMTQTVWEQYGLARSANQIGADAIYSHAECGPLWGPAVLLHVPEDPFVRWHGCKPDTSREHARRAYQRATMRRGLSHASVVAASSSAGRSALASRFGLDSDTIALVPLGVDTQLFHPIAGAVHGNGNGIFHLSSSEARDMTHRSRPRLCGGPVARSRPSGPLDRRRPRRTRQTRARRRKRMRNRTAGAPSRSYLRRRASTALRGCGDVRATLDVRGLWAPALRGPCMRCAPDRIPRGGRRGGGRRRGTCHSAPRRILVGHVHCTALV